MRPVGTTVDNQPGVRARMAPKPDGAKAGGTMVYLEFCWRQAMNDVQL